MSSQTDEFLVINENVENQTEDILDQLHETVFLFGKSINALNQSTILLKDELQRVLSTSLGRLEGNQIETVEELLKSFHKSMKSDEQIRSDYIKRICSRLVLVDDERQKLEAELNKMKSAQYLSNANLTNTTEHNEELRQTSKTIEKIESLLDQLSVNASCDNKNEETQKEDAKCNDTTLTEIHKRLSVIYERMLHLVEERQAGDHKEKFIEQSWYDMLGEFKNNQTSDDKAENQEKINYDKKEASITQEGERTPAPEINHNESCLDESPETDKISKEQPQHKQQQLQGKLETHSQLETQIEDVIVRTLSRFMSGIPGPLNYNNTMMLPVFQPKVSLPLNANKSGSECNNESNKPTENQLQPGAFPTPMLMSVGSPGSFSRPPPRGTVQLPFRPSYSGAFHPRGPVIRNRFHNAPRPQQPRRYPNTGGGPQTEKNVTTGRTRSQDNKREPAWIPDFIFD